MASTKPLDADRVAIAIKILSERSPGQIAVAEYLIEEGAKGATTQEIFTGLQISPPEASRRLSAVREASQAAGLKESALIRSKKEAREKRWFATELLMGAASKSGAIRGSSLAEASP